MHIAYVLGQNLVIKLQTNKHIKKLNKICWKGCVLYERQSIANKRFHDFLIIGQWLKMAKPDLSSNWTI
jgi:hypothetical protein